MMAIKDRFLAFGKPDIGDEEKAAVAAVLDSGWISTGPVAAAFEKEFEKFLGEGHAVAVSSCTDGLILALLVAGVHPGNEVITTPMTFVATVNAILAVGAKPVFVDVTASGHMDPRRIESALTPRTAAILPVHYTGSACDMIPIMSAGRGHGIPVIEDCAHAFGGFHAEQKKKIGTIGDYSVFSFYPTKNITSVEGGMVMVKTERQADLVRALSMQGLSAGAHKRYESGNVTAYHLLAPGRKANMSDIHAAIGLTQLRRWPEIKNKRDAVWEVYERAFAPKGAGHSRHLYTLRHRSRDAIRRYLAEEGIGTGLHFNAAHLEPGYAFLNYRKGQFPMAEAIGATTFSLPVSATMTTEDAERVVKSVLRAIEVGES